MRLYMDWGRRTGRQTNRLIYIHTYIRDYGVRHDYIIEIWIHISSKLSQCINSLDDAAWLLRLPAVVAVQREVGAAVGMGIGTMDWRTGCQAMGNSCLQRSSLNICNALAYEAAAQPSLTHATTTSPVAGLSSIVSRMQRLKIKCCRINKQAAPVASWQLHLWPQNCCNKKKKKTGGE